MFYKEECKRLQKYLFKVFSITNSIELVKNAS